MKLNAKVRNVGIIGGVLLVVVIILGKQFNIPVVSTSVNYVLYPFEKSISWVTNISRNGLSYFKDIETLKTENEALKAENSKLIYKNSILNQYQEENDNLKQLLEMKQLYKDYEGVGANVIGNDSGNWYKTFTIDKGTKHGVYENSVILSDGGLVGQVIDVSGLSVSGTTALTSKVISIIDSRSAVSAEVARTGEVGIVKGDVELSNEGLCVLEITTGSGAEVIKGDQIITSQISDIYPPGIPIGTVEEVVESTNGLTQYAHVRPIVDFKHLKQVLVLNTKSKE